MIVKLRFGDGGTHEYDVEMVEVQTIEPVLIQSADHGYAVVLTDGRQE